MTESPYLFYLQNDWKNKLSPAKISNLLYINYSLNIAAQKRKKKDTSC